MHRFPKLSQPIIQSCSTRGAISRSSAAICSQPQARVCFSTGNPSAFSQTVRKEPTTSRERAVIRPHLRDIPIVALGIPAKDGTLGMRMAEWQTGRYAWVVDENLRAMEIDDSLRYLRSEYTSLMERYQKTRGMRKRHVGFDEDLLAVERVMMCRREVLMSRIFELETYEDGLKPAAKMGVFRSM